MSALWGALKRCWQIDHPPVATKSEDALKFGILGAASIAPVALITPARSHPDVVIQAVAARNKTKAEAYAKAHGIPEVKDSYQALLDDPAIQCIYIPQPTGHHLEWALRSLKAGKHVLLEKPAVANGSEAEVLFSHPALTSGPNPPVFLEAVHYRFHPAWAAFLAQIDPPNVAHAWSALWAPVGMLGADDIRWKFDLAGGFLLDCGAYTVAVLRQIFGEDADGCEECVMEPSPIDARCDRVFKARYRFPNGGYGEVEGSARAWRFSPDIEVTHRTVRINAEDVRDNVGKIRDTQEVVKTRKVYFKNFVRPAYLHSIQVEDEFVLRTIGNGGTEAASSVIKRWKVRKTVKAYTWGDVEGMEHQPGEPYWQSYRYMLEQFVNKVKGKEAKQWVGGADSKRTAKMIDMAYETAGLPLRPTSEYR